MANTTVPKSDKQFLQFTDFLDIDNFIHNSNLNDTNYSNGVMRLNRFVGIIDVKQLKPNFQGLQHNNEVEDYGNDFLAWNIFKINCPAFRLETDTREVDAIPRHYFKSWQHDDLEVSYLESADMKIRHYFFEWLESALSSRTLTRNYYDDVMAKWFIIYPLNFQGQAERYEIFEDVVPTEINSINYDVADDGSQTVLTTVKFKYIRHRLLSLTTGSAKDLTKGGSKWNAPPEDKKR